MKTAIRETKNSVTVPLLRSKGPCAQGRGIVRRASFLGGIALAVALGSVLAPPMPSFAQDAGTTVRAIGNHEIADTTITTSPAGTITVVSTESVVGNLRRTIDGGTTLDSTTPSDTVSTIVNTVVTTSGDVSGENTGTGVFVSRKGVAGDLDVVNNANISSVNYGIKSTRDGDDDLNVVNNGRITDAKTDGIHAEHTGEGILDVSSAEEVEAANGGRGVYASHSGNGKLKVSASSSVEAGGAGIYVRHSGRRNYRRAPGENVIHGILYTVMYDDSFGGIDVDVSSGGSVTSTTSDGVFVEYDGAGVGEIDLDVYGAISGHSTGLSVSRKGQGNIDISVFSNITSNIKGIFAEHKDWSDGDVVIGIKNLEDGSGGGTINSAGRGIFARHTGSFGDIDIDVSSKGSVTSTGHDGIYAYYGRYSPGSYVANTNGEVDIDVYGSVNAHRSGIWASRNGNGNVDISLFSSLEAGNSGIFAEHRATGRGDVVINVKNLEDGSGGGTINSTGRGIFARYSGALGNTHITSEGSIISTGSDGIFVSQNDAGVAYVDVHNVVKGRSSGISVIHSTRRSHPWYGGTLLNVHRGGSVSATEGHAIRVRTNKYDRVGINIAGSVSGNNTHDAINVAAGRSVYVALYPGASLKGRVVATGALSLPAWRRFYGARAGLVLRDGNYHGFRDPGLFRFPSSSFFSGPGFLNLSEVEFSGFSTWKTFSKSIDWIVTGTMNENAGFQTAEIDGGSTLRFSSAAFKLQEDTSLFSIYRSSFLEIAGSSSLKGSLRNLGKIEFVQEENADGSPTDRLITDGSLTVTGDYSEGGELVFNVKFDDEQANKLTIGGDVDYSSTIRHGVEVSDIKGSVSMLATGVLGSDSEPVKMSPTLIQVEGDADEDDFEGTQDVDELYRYQLKYRAATVAAEDEEDEDREVNQWYFAYSGRSPSEDVVTGNARDMSDTLSDPVDSPDPDEEPNKNLGFRADVRGYAGGPWARRQSFRTLRNSGGITNGRSRTQGDRIHFGYNVPAVSFMGGDMAVGASMSQGFSTSDVSSPSGKGGTSLESRVAALAVSWRSPEGFYAGGQTRYARFLSDISTDRYALARDNEGSGVGVSAKLGYRFDVPLGGMDFSVAPQVRLAWSRVDFEDFTGPSGALISLEDGDFMTGRLGLSWDGEWQDTGGSGRIYGGISLRDAVDGRMAVNISGVSLASKQSLSTDGRLGVSYEWDKGYEVRGEVAAMRRDEAEEFRANLGMNINF